MLSRGPSVSLKPLQSSCLLLLDDIRFGSLRLDWWRWTGFRYPRLDIDLPTSHQYYTYVDDDHVPGHDYLSSKKSNPQESWLQHPISLESEIDFPNR